MSRKEHMKPCKYCGSHDVIIEQWMSGGRMYMVRCNNSDCPVPPEGFPTGETLMM